MSLEDSECYLPVDLKLELEEIATKSSVDLRDYASQVDKELSKMENSLIESYISAGPNVARLHNQIVACDSILERMETILSSFHEDLGTISSEIQDLQKKSVLMNTRLQNRQAVRGELSQFLSDMAIPEDLIRHILLTPVTEQSFLENLHELDHKINFALEKSMIDYKSFEDVSSLLKKLKIKAVTKIREFLLQKIYSLRKPLANYQIPQNQMLKYRFYNAFLLAHDREIAREIQTEYVSTMSKVYYSYFRAYCGKLVKLQLDQSTDKDDLLGKHSDKSGPTPATMISQVTTSVVPHAASTLTTTSTSSRVGLFGLGDRAVRVLGQSSLESPIILPHVASKADVKYPIEVLFRSIHYALLDTACREYYFLSDFFMLSPPPSDSDPDKQGFDPASPISRSSNSAAQALANLFDQIMGNTLTYVQKHVETQIIPSAVHDALGLLICLQILYAMLRLARDRAVPVLDRFWTKMTDSLWIRVIDRLDAHIASLQQNVDTIGLGSGARDMMAGISTSGTASTSGGPVGLNPKAYALVRPHPIARRYAELAASLHSIGHEYPGTPLFAESSPAPGPTNANDPDSKESHGEPVRKDSLSTKPLHMSGSSSSLSSLPTQLGSGLQPPSNKPQLDVRIISRLAQLQSQFESVLSALTKTFPRPRLAQIFMINNYDLVISVLTEHGFADSAEVARCRESVALHTTAFIDEALAPYFGSLISFVRDVEARANAPPNTTDPSEASIVARNEEGRVTRIVKGFNIDWKNSIEKIHDEIMMEFANFTLGTQIFQALLAQLVQHYHRFQKVMTQSPYKSMPVRNQLVNIHHIMTEIKKCKMSF